MLNATTPLYCFVLFNTTPTIFWVSFIFRISLIGRQRTGFQDFQLSMPITRRLPIALGNYLGLLPIHRPAF